MDDRHRLLQLRFVLQQSVQLFPHFTGTRAQDSPARYQDYPQTCKAIRLFGYSSRLFGGIATGVFTGSSMALRLPQEPLAYASEFLEINGITQMAQKTQPVRFS